MMKFRMFAILKLNKMKNKKWVQGTRGGVRNGYFIIETYH